MIVQTDRERLAGAAGVPVAALAALGRALASAAQRPSLAAALDDLAGAAKAAAAADLALVRVLDPAGEQLETIAVAGPAPLAAELAGTIMPASDLPETALTALEGAPPAARRAAERAGAAAFFLVPLRTATLELYRSVGEFSRDERLAAELAAGQTALVLRAFEPRPGGADAPVRPALELAGEALAAALDETSPPDEVARIAATVAGAAAALLWVRSAGGGLELAGSHGLAAGDAPLPARELAEAALEQPARPRLLPGSGLPAGCEVSAGFALGRPSEGVLQFLFSADAAPAEDELERLALFGVRVAHALRAGARARELAVELERTRALLAVVGQATAELSLAHTLDTAVDRVAELFGVPQVAVYLRDGDDGLAAAAERGLTGPHAAVAERLLELALGPGRPKPVVEVADARLRGAREAAREAGIDAAFAAPLVVRDDVIGLIALYPARGRRATEPESALLAALAGQLAVAVQNAQLHERATELGRQREDALASEREAAKRLRALYEISASFAESLSLEATLDALASTAVDVLGVDAAVIRLPDERREVLVPRAFEVRDEHLKAAAKPILHRPQAFGTSGVRSLFRDRVPIRLGRNARPGDGGELLAPFLEKGWTGAVVPVATPAEVIASLSIFSFRPGEPIDDETIDAAVAIAGQAALAIDNARLYQQQKAFADTMQRSLLPRVMPDVPGLQIGEVYESSARVDVGGDLYDYLTLDDGRLAVVLGDVTGHGVEATADMAMAKFLFRSLAREHPEPADFLAAVNDVVVDEIAPGKFITLVYLAVDGVRSRVACASAGHPAPRIVTPVGRVTSLEAPGLVLGVEADQRYEEVSADLPPGAALVLFTDGVIEARRDGELYGFGRLDALLAEQHALPPRELALAITEDCRSFAGGELSDDVAVVVIRRT